ncbi:hypothetical protein ACFPPA_00010 [Rhodanobacter ginsengisoli]|uniref:Uncharacterized protein n=1 Tax=Rhodanobacter ginsengisoli TaxID=418646 RepID=A0ABW0QH48_9GAMM
MSLPESPIADIDLFDIIGVRKDGGIDTVVACSGPLDNSAETLSRLARKVRGYLSAITGSDFIDQYGKGQVRIFVSCCEGVSAEALDVINSLGHEAADQNVHLSLGDPVA